jgi:hypothetical protein
MKPAPILIVGVHSSPQAAKETNVPSLAKRGRVREGALVFVLCHKPGKQQQNIPSLAKRGRVREGALLQ